MKQRRAPAMNESSALIREVARAVMHHAGQVAYRPEIFRTIFKTTQKPTMPTMSVATAVKTVVAVAVIVDGSANVVPPLD
jgi:hypothetical protein